MKKSLILIFALLLLPGFVLADSAIPVFIDFYGFMGVIFLIPVILLETIAAYLIIFRNKYFETNFWKILGIFAIANVASTIIGYALSSLIGYNVKSSIGYFYVIIPAFILSVIIEWGILYLFVKKKREDAPRFSLKLAIITNCISYAAIVIFFFYRLLT